MTSRRRGAVAGRTLLTPILVAALTVLALLGGACSDGTSEFCAPLSEASDLGALAEALRDDDLSAARAEAERLADLAETAPSEIRSDLVALADSVVDIVGMLEDEQRAGDTDSDSSGVSAAQVERQREELNERFGELDRRATRVTTWAARECGLDLA
jgi:hypothetical protein